MTSIFNVAKPANIETEVARVRAENQALLGELEQCQGDKEFVWSLWKRLQVASPDITQAVGMVVQREKEKSELKDRKVLEILQLKDDKIDELQTMLSSHVKEAANLQTLKLEMHSDLGRLKLENDDLKTRCDSLNRKIQDIESVEHQSAGRQAIREMDQEILELKQKLSKRDRDVLDLTKDKTDLSVIRESQRERIGQLEEDVRSVGQKYESLAKEQTDTKNLLKNYENQFSSLQRELGDKNMELERMRHELGDLWQTHDENNDHTTEQAGLIKQMKDLQRDTQQMMKNQEDAYNIESKSLQTMYQSLRTQEIDLHRTIQRQKQQLVEQEDFIADLQRQLDELGVKTQAIQTSFGADDKDSQASDSDFEMNQRLHNLQSELDSLRNRMTHPPDSRHSTCDRASSPIRHQSSPSRRSRSHSQEHNHSRLRSRSPVQKDHPSRSRSEPRSRSGKHSQRQEDTEGELQKKLGTAERKLEDFGDLLEIKNLELEETRNAHARRLERLRSLQSNYRLIKKQLKLVEEENAGPRKKRKRIPRADPKSLQKEDSDSVWNEVAFFRNENRNLFVEKTNLQEQVDLLRVQTAQDAATIYELRSCLEQEREELQFITEQQERAPSPTPQLELQLKKSNKEAKRLHKQLKSIQEDNQMLTSEREKALVERRDMKTHINTLQQKDAEYRIKIADFNREMARLQRELKRRKKPKGKTQIAKQYQRVLNRSIDRMQNVFDHFTPDGWEEVSDTEDQPGSSQEVTCSTETADRTMQSDISYSQPTHTSSPSPVKKVRQIRPNVRQKESVAGHVNRIAKPSYSPTREPTVRRDPSPAHRRDIALSPIHFLGAKGTTRSHPVTTSVGTSPHCVSKKVYGNSNAVIRQVATLKQRVQSLQHQVSLLRTSRDNLSQKSQEQKDTINRLQSDLTSANQKLHSSRLTVQRLTSDLERLRGEKEVMEQQMEEYSFGTNSTTQHTEQEWGMLQSRLKSSTNEVSKQLTQIKTLKAEHSEQREKISQLQDRINHLERDVTQKRTLLEDMRIKLRFAQENAQTDADVMTEVEAKLKSLSEANSRYKTQLESFRNRLSAVSKEKSGNEEKVFKLSEEIERKSKQAADLHRKNAELQSTVIAIEKTAQHQLHALANQSEVAIDSAQSKLIQASTRLQEHDKFVKVLTHALLNSLQQARSLWLQQKQRKKESVVPPRTDLDPSLKRAQSLACDILNLSQSDLDDIMSVHEYELDDKLQAESTEKSEDSKKDKKWSKKIEKAIQYKVEFALPLTELFMEKVDERNRLAAKLQIS